MNIQEGDILLTHTHYTGGINVIGKKLIPAGIRLVTNSYWNHAAIVVRFYGALCVLEADIKGTRITKTLKVWEDESRLGVRDYAVIRTNTFNKNKVHGVLGVPYDHKALFIDQLIYRLGKKQNKNWYFGHTENFATAKMYCSEVVAYLCDLENFNKITPADLAGQFKLIYTHYNKI